MMCFAFRAVWRGLIASAMIAFPVAAVAVCTAAGSEPGEACFSSSAAIHGGEHQFLHFCDDGSDWVSFNACAGRRYTIEASDVEWPADTAVELYAPDCTTQLVLDDAAGGGLHSRLVWTALTSGTFHIRVRQKSGTSDGRAYRLLLDGDTSPCSTWMRRFDEVYDPGASHATGSAVPLSDGGYFLAWNILGASPGTDLWVAKLDGAGTVLWQQSLAGVETQQSTEVVRTSDGNVVVVGNAGLDDHVGDLTSPDVLAFKLSPSGSLLWQRRFGKGHKDEASDAQPTADGGVVIVGHTNSFGTFNDEDIWVLKLDASGHVTWSKRYDACPPRGVAIRESQAGGYVVIGEGCQSIWMMKLAADGSFEWQKGYDGDLPSIVGQAVVSMADGGYAVAGRQNTSGLPKLVVLRLDAAGNVVWARRYGDNVAQLGLGSTSDGSLLVTVERTAPFATNFLVTDGFLLKLDSGGTPLWERRIGTSLNQAFWLIRETDDQGLLLLGTDGTGPAVLKIDPSGLCPDCPYVFDSAASVADFVPTISTESVTVNDFLGISLASTFVPQSAASPSLAKCPCSSPPPYTGVVRMDKLGSVPVLSWDAAGTSLYDIVQGDLDVLLETGSFPQALLSGSSAYVCLADDIARLSWEDTSGLTTSRFYLLRPVTEGCLAPGSYDEGGAQVSPRDPQIEASQYVCP